MSTYSFAVVDTETTGLFPGRSDRIVEVGVVVMDDDGTRRTEYATLVNPGRDVGRTDIHGIRAGDLAEAPTFPEIVGDLAERFNGRVIVAHNARFDQGFLLSEFERAGYRFPDTAWLCSMEIGGYLTGARSLAGCRDALGLDDANAHCALDDAEAAATIVERCMRTPAGRMLIEERLRAARIASPDTWPPVGPSGKVLTRTEARVPRVPTYVGQLLARLPQNAHLLESAHAAYLEVLDRALEDRRVAADEAEALFEVAEAWKIGRETATDLHKRYLRHVAQIAWEDGVLSHAEQTDLEWVAAALGEHQLLEELLAAPELTSTPPSTRDRTAVRADGLVGKTVCFTGALIGTRGGRAITRHDAEALASAAGLLVQHSVTKKLDLLVVADPDTQSGKALKAREYGIRVLAERVFWGEIDVQID